MYSLELTFMGVGRPCLEYFGFHIATLPNCHLSSKRLLSQGPLIAYFDSTKQCWLLASCHSTWMKWLELDRKLLFSVNGQLASLLPVGIFNLVMLSLKYNLFLIWFECSAPCYLDHLPRVNKGHSLCFTTSHECHYPMTTQHHCALWPLRALVQIWTCRQLTVPYRIARQLLCLWAVLFSEMCSSWMGFPSAQVGSFPYSVQSKSHNNPRRINWHTCWSYSSSERPPIITSSAIHRTLGKPSKVLL